MQKLVLACAVLASTAAHADRRAYGTTYEAVTAPQGELDLELWSTVSPMGELDGGPASKGLRQMVELEYGITDAWDVALYNMFDAIHGGDTESGYAGFKVETRWRPSQRGEWFVDPVFYFELQQRLRGDAKESFEGKVILAKDLGNVNLAANVSIEEERPTYATWNPECEYALGTSYGFSRAFLVGAEAFGKLEKADMGGLQNRTWVGPSISWATGAGGALRGVWVTLAGGGAVTSDADKYYGRLIVGLQFK